MDPVRDWLKATQDETLLKYNTILFRDIWDKYAKGTPSAWEMDSLCFYHGPHELINVNTDKYDLVDFFELNPESDIERFWKRGKNKIPIYQLYKIIGTVISKNDNKSSISLLTTTGVVTVKFTREQYSKYKRQISEIQADGKKKVASLKEQGVDPTRHIEANDNLDVTAQYAINEGNGLILKEVVAYYRDYAADLADQDAELRNAILQNFATERGWNAHEKDSCDWEIAIFDGMPVGASITILTKMQNDVRATESQLIQYLMDRTDAGDLRVNKLNAYVIPNSNYVIRGGKYSAQIILAAID
jgi:hypothetical protein